MTLAVGRFFFCRLQIWKSLQPCQLPRIHTSQIFQQSITEANLSLDNKNVCRYLESIRQEFYNLKTAQNVQVQNIRRVRRLSEVVSTYEQRNCVLQNINSLKDIEDEKDPDMKQLIKDEKEVYQGILNTLNQNLMNQLLNLGSSESYSSLIFEVSAGVGGQEAMLFAKNLLDMYTNFLEFKGWDYELINSDRTDIGGLRHATILVYSEEAYQILKHEGGVHRVQRVPSTEKSGRIHTSTVSVAVIPRPDDIESIIDEKDLKIETKRASGAGGQHVNTTDSAVRIIHNPSGIVVECQTDRSQLKNKDIALKKLQTKLIEQQMDAQEASKSATRKAQVGSSNRNEKIRTYNFTQDRITDHRIKGGTLHNLEGFLQGDESLDALINELVVAERRAELLDIINNITEQVA